MPTETPTTNGNSTGRPKRKGEGGQIANFNAGRHGLRSGKLPPGCAYIARATNEFRRALEDAVLAVRDEISIIDAANICSAIRFERHALLAQRWLRLECEKFDPTVRLNYSKAVAWASVERDRCLKSLGLDKTAVAGFWDSIDAIPVERPSKQGQEPPRSTTNGRSSTKPPEAVETPLRASEAISPLEHGSERRDKKSTGSTSKKQDKKSTPSTSYGGPDEGPIDVLGPLETPRREPA